MAEPLLSKGKADAIANGVFLICLGILLYSSERWWPGILLAIWGSLAVRQYLTGRIFDFAISSFILLGLFLATIFQISWSTLMPLLFVIGGVYLVVREYWFTESIEQEGSRALKKEIKEEIKTEIEKEKMDDK
ncbi:hypothetical protein [Parachlamydia sp. AcF125]|uniref:hypothetical protein n=1 Tax=Parachlamydia sp. AcF125 TaxID=2795736 RepID=UPI001BC8D0F1|nr:hypothetical protein [Parachlamydia sp. AcF125]MBS4167383.1 hypothetical protein [Parachlamydia sp. AcF125]